jgi:hypothetical protein
MARFYPSNAFKGRSGGYVGENYNGTAYFRHYRTPYDPKTPAQRGVRAMFRQVTDIAQTINYGILRPYTFPKPPKGSPYNHMTAINAPLMAAHEWNPAALKILDGTLYNPGIQTAQIILTHERAAVYITFDPHGGDPTDIACLVVNDEAADLTYYQTGTRRKGALDIAIAPKGYPPDFSKVYAYLCFAREPDDLDPTDAGQNSPTAFKKVTLAADPLTQVLAQ